MKSNLGNVGRNGDVGEESGGASRCVAVLNEAPYEACETEGDVDGGEAEHEHGDAEDRGADLAGAAKAHDVDIGHEQTDVDACVGACGCA